MRVQGTLQLELAVATVMVLTTVLIHAVGLLLLLEVTRRLAHEELELGIHPLSVRGLSLIMIIVLGLFALHGSEIWLYAALYLQLGAIEGLRNAVYFSTQTYAAIGFGDKSIRPDWKMVAGIEGINGVILIGWSTAFFVTMMGRLGRRA